MPGPETLLLVAIVAIVIFGGAKIPELARSLGKAKGEFAKGLQEGDRAKAEAASAEASAAPIAAPAAPPGDPLPAPAAPPAAPAVTPEPAKAEGSDQ
jgi:sec-independent protein translocase protein TatA